MKKQHLHREEAYREVIQDLAQTTRLQRQRFLIKEQGGKTRCS